MLRRGGWSAGFGVLDFVSAFGRVFGRLRARSASSSDVESLGRRRRRRRRRSTSAADEEPDAAVGLVEAGALERDADAAEDLAQLRPLQAGHSVRASSVNDCTTSSALAAGLAAVLVGGHGVLRRLGTRTGRVPNATGAAPRTTPSAVLDSPHVPAPPCARPSSPPPGSAPGSCRPPRPSPRRCCRSSTRRRSSTWSRRRCAAGIDDILIITGRNKRAIEDHFDRNVELELELREQGQARRAGRRPPPRRPRRHPLRPPGRAARPRPRRRRWPASTSATSPFVRAARRRPHGRPRPAARR